MLCLGFGYIQKCTLSISKKPIQSLFSLIADGKTQLAKMGICGMRDEVIFSAMFVPLPDLHNSFSDLGT